MAACLKSRLATVALLAAGLAVSLVGVFQSPTAAAAGLPSGERIHGQSTLEPVYDDTTGNTIFIMTPNKAPLNANPTAWAPIYIVVYPTSAAASVGTLQCAHVPADNCPDHGPAVAAGAAAANPSVYGPPDGSGVLGHDHLLAPPGSGGDFNIAWEPVLVVFTTAGAANTHLTTLAQIDFAVSHGQAFEIKLPQLTFHCEVVPANLYANSTPVTPV